MEIIITTLPVYIEKNNNNNCNTEGKSKQVNQGSSALFENIPEGIFKITVNHALSFMGFPIECQMDARLLLSALFV